MKFLVDMNLSPRWVGFLSENGYEAIHWSNVGASDAPDSDLMSWAAEHGRIVLTNDLGLAAILAATQGVRPSVIQIRGDLLDTMSIGGAVLAAVRQAEADLANGAILSVDISQSRLRILPFASEPQAPPP